jgi:hypothetical protein
MSHGILPEGEQLRRAMQWINTEKQDRPDAKLVALIGEAALRFNLSPAQEEWLLTTLAKKP